MALRQTRRTVSISRAIAEQVYERCSADDIPASQAFEQLAKLWLSGAVTLEPAKPAKQETRAGKPRGRMIAFDGREQTITDWAETIGVSVHTLRDRLERMPVERALTMRKGRYTRGHASSVAPRATQIHTSGTCAICIEYRTDLVMSEDGYKECGTCRTVPAIARRGPDRCYDAPDRSPALTGPEIRKAMHRVFGEERVERDSRDRRKVAIEPKKGRAA